MNKKTYTAPTAMTVQVLTEDGTLAAFSGPGAIRPDQPGGDLAKENYNDDWDDDDSDEACTGW